jgi:hypothetical protein
MAKTGVVAPDLVKQIHGLTSLGSAVGLLEKVLQAQYAGRRGAVRTFKFLDLSVEGRGGAYEALGINISRSGLLLRITDARFATEDDQLHLMTYTARVLQEFQGGFQVLLEGGVVARTADVVRVSGYCGTKSSLVLVGCRFREELTREECELLSIAYHEAA